MSNKLKLPWKHTIRWLLFIHLIAMSAMELTKPFWPLYLRELSPLSGIPFAWTSAAVYLLPMATALLSTPWWGYLGDRVGHKPMLLRALIALGITQLWIIFSESVMSVLIARTIQGFFSGSIAAAQAYAVSLTPSDQRRYVLTDLQTMTVCSSFFAPLVGGWLIDLAGFHYANVIATFFIFICILLVFICLPMIKPITIQNAMRPAKFISIKDTITRLVGGMLIAIVAVQAGSVMPHSFLVPYVSESLHGSMSLAGMAYSGTALAFALSARWWVKILARFSIHITLKWLSVFVALCFATTLWQAYVEIEMLIVARFFGGLWLGGLLPILTALVSQMTVDQQQGFALGLCSSASKGGALIGLSIVAVVTGMFGWRSGFFAIAVVYVIAFVSLIAVQLYIKIG